MSEVLKYEKSSLYSSKRNSTKKLMTLVKLHGTQTEAIAFAIESLWQKEVEGKK